MGYSTAKLINGALKNGSSSNLAVNGSVTPQVFIYNPPSGSDIEISVVCLVVETTNAIAFGNKFIDTTLSTLSNGLLIEGKADDVSFTWQNAKRTRDLVEIATAAGIDVVTGTTNLFHCHFWLPSALRLYKAGTYTPDDYLKVTVRDDLTKLSYAEIFWQGVKL